MPRHTTEQIMNRIKGMGPISEEAIHLVKKEPVLVLEGDGTRYWAILNDSVLTTPDFNVRAEDVINRNGTIYVIGGPISTEE